MINVDIENLIDRKSVVSKFKLSGHDGIKTRQLDEKSICNINLANFKTNQTFEPGMAFMFTKKSSDISLGEHLSKVKQLAIYNNTLHYKTIQNDLLQGFQF